MSHRLQQQPAIAHSHGFSVNTLPPPNSSYVPQPLPPSPYHESSAHEHRSLPDPAPHGYTQSSSGQNTPIRDSRSYPLDPSSYSRRGSASASTRSPDGYPTFPTARPLNNAAGNDAQHYPPQYPIETAGHYSGYANNDGPMNGNPHHGLPMSTYGEQSHPNPPPPGHPSDYGPSSVNAVQQHPYGGGGGGSTYGGAANHQNMQRPKKGNRAQQVRWGVCSGGGRSRPPLNRSASRRVTFVGREKRNAMKAGQRAGSASRIRCHAIIKPSRPPSMNPPPPHHPSSAPLDPATPPQPSS